MGPNANQLSYKLGDNIENTEDVESAVEEIAEGIISTHFKFYVESVDRGYQVAKIRPVDHGNPTAEISTYSLSEGEVIESREINGEGAKNLEKWYEQL